MTLGKRYDRIKPRLLQGRRKKHRRIEARSESPLQNLAREPDLLAIFLEACGRKGIRNTQIRDRRVDRRRDLPDSLAAAGFVSIDAIVLSSLAQARAGIAKNAVDRRIVRHRERRKQFGHISAAAPLIVGEQLNNLLFLPKDSIA